MAIIFFKDLSHFFIFIYFSLTSHAFFHFDFHVGLDHMVKLIIGSSPNEYKFGLEDFVSSE